MATQVQLRGGTTSEHSSFTGAAREVTVDTDKDVVVVHDGSTAGGIPLAKEASVLPLAGGTMTGTIAGFTSTGIDDNATSTAITIDASEHVGIGTTTPNTNLTISDGTDEFDFGVTTNKLTIKSVTTDGADDQIISIDAGNGAGSSIRGAYISLNGNETAGFSGKIILGTGNVTGADVVFNGSGGTERMRMLTGGGLTFNGDTAAANALDDYEEGTWTPSLDGTLTYSYQDGKYTKIGNIVTVFIDIDITAWSGGGTIPRISLPFSAKSGYYASVIPWTVSNTFTDTTNQLTGYTTGAGINLYKTAGASNQYASGMNKDVIGRLAFQITYQAI